MFLNVVNRTLPDRSTVGTSTRLGSRIPMRGRWEMTALPGGMQETPAPKLPPAGTIAPPGSDVGWLGIGPPGIGPDGNIGGGVGRVGSPHPTGGSGRPLFGSIGVGGICAI